ncbi:MAG TPA: hypothetical protein VGH80_12375 [Xanthomonadaceae bacterium]|jgi:hypothetical protein
MVLIIEDKQLSALLASSSGRLDADTLDSDETDTTPEDPATDDPGDAQRASKTEPDGDGEEELR